MASLQAEASDEMTSPSGMRFRVEEVVESPPKAGSITSVGSNPSLDGAPMASLQSETHNRTVGTIGYSTSEAVPMTMFYRNQDSNAPKKTRPTLAELHNDTQDDEVDATTCLLGDGIPNISQVNSDTAIDAEATGGAAAPPMVVKFGWIKGVLIRCLLNIWGVMLFLRLSWVVGQAGIGQAILVILLATVVTVLTTLSMSAICTNGEVRGGGAYYLISRSLGPEFGGAIGIVFSVANAVAVALYVVGFAETVRDLLKEHDSLFTSERWVVVIVGLATVTLLLCIALIGMAWEARAQTILLAMLLIAIANFAIGTFIGPKSDAERAEGFLGYNGTIHNDNFKSGYTDGNTFFTVFSIFFPAATGILAGANISGDLKEPQKAIPKGTLVAIGISTVLYIVMAWMVGANVMRNATGVLSLNETIALEAMNATCPVGGCQFGLLNTYQNMELVSGFKYLITAGIFSATLSSALASLVGAPKVFQAVCKDRLFPLIHVFAKGSGPSGTEPHRGYFLTFFIAICFILIGDLDAIAPIISNFFLLSYALINFSCFNASFANSPGWRPAFKYYNSWMALLGAVLCVAVMFMINWWTALITIVIVSFLYKYIDYKKPKVNWGSSGQALTYSNALRFCAKLDSTDDHVKNYRPQVLVLSGLPSDRPDLTWIAHSMTKDVAMMTCGNIIQGPDVHYQNRQVQRERNNKWLSTNKIKAFQSVVVYPDFRQGALSLLQSSGLGKLRPNILFLGYKSDWLGMLDTKELQDYVNVIHDAFDLSYAVAIMRLPGLGFYRQRKEGDTAAEEAVDSVGKRLAMATEASSLENIPRAANYLRDTDEVRFTEPTASSGNVSSGEAISTSRTSSANRTNIVAAGATAATGQQQQQQQQYNAYDSSYGRGAQQPPQQQQQQPQQYQQQASGQASGYSQGYSQQQAQQRAPPPPPQQPYVGSSGQSYYGRQGGNEAAYDTSGQQKAQQSQQTQQGGQSYYAGKNHGGEYGSPSTSHPSYGGG
eukprot:scpid38063/ scgid28000/ Solute carrier family 12 member 2; Basolateral Na-K-Cl symporter; Bumetanide-sensitive sodium-(potassium)-chloride cotransporter 1